MLSKRDVLAVVFVMVLGPWSTVVLANSARSPTGGGSRGDTAGIIQAFVIPHSHMDVGWIYTVQESVEAYAMDVYTTVVANLAKDRNRRFIAVEQEFFRLWWTTVASDMQKKQTHLLVQYGQLEFIIGGQVMHDEAVSEYSATIQQMTEGHSFIYETFGKRPHFSWHVDPFGASSATPTLFALMGFDAHLTSRIDYDVKAQMQKDKGLQFVWRASPSLGKSQQIFTHVMDQYSYCVPPHLSFSLKTGFYWNGYAVFPKPPAGVPYPDMSLPVTDQNIKQYAATMVDNIKQRAAWFQTQQLLWPWGCDKQFFNATIQFLNMDKLVAYINQHSTDLGVHVQYATLGDYFTAVHNTSHSWALKQDGDFLSYSSDADAAWTGFYTSRSGLKDIARRSQSTLHAAETLFSVYLNQPNLNRTANTTEVLGSLQALRWASAEVQHHDGITGTDSVKVKAMYEDHLETAENMTLASMKEMLQDFHNNSQEGEKKDVFTSVGRGHILDVSRDKPLTPILVYNSLGWSVKRLVQMSITDPNVTVIDIHGRDIGSQVNPPLEPGGPYHLFFYAQLAPLNFDVYYIKNKIQPEDATSPQGKLESLGTVVRSRTPSQDKKRKLKDTDVKSISNDCFEVAYNTTTNMLMSILDKQTNKTVSMEQIFMEYNSHHNVLYGQTSNLYVFRPWSNGPQNAGDSAKLDIVTGPYVNETRQSIFNMYDPKSSRYMVTLRIFDLPHSHNDDIVCGHIELDFKVGPLTPNKELVYRFSTNLNNSRVLYTNDNGFQTMKRTWRPNKPQPEAQNYYPLVSTAYIESPTKDTRLTVMAERSHGVGSLNNGQMEVMLLRRLITNSGYADKNNLTLEEPDVVMPTLWLLLGNGTHSSELQRRAWLQLENPPIIMAVNQSMGAWAKKWKGDKSGNIPKSAEFLRQWKEKYLPNPLSTVFKDLPHNVHLLTLKTPGWTYNTSHKEHEKKLRARLRQGRYDGSGETPNLDRILLRLQHLYEVGEHKSLSQPVTIDLAKYLFPFGTVANVSERSLTAIWPADKVKRWTWKVKGGPKTGQKSSATGSAPTWSKSPTSITLHAQEIKTFFITFQKKNP
ncbi:epididymis-specific alpha-mannosidase-like isoform X2 [Patiria miniata]|uniref:Alpha-mannosidase n=1 Tax=Patiria miniata TaxID=46514 RepID=A0A913Z2P6_PATMI|nr:epididymis-specific alpha-mannosidase-like isoform X2 [Patiria miniata]